MGDPLSVRTARERDLPRIAELEDLVFEGTGFNRSTLMQLHLEVGWIMALGGHPGGFQDTGEWKDGDVGDGEERHNILTLLLPVL